MSTMRTMRTMKRKQQDDGEDGEESKRALTVTAEVIDLTDSDCEGDSVAAEVIDLTDSESDSDSDSDSEHAKGVAAHMDALGEFDITKHEEWLQFASRSVEEREKAAEFLRKVCATLSYIQERDGREGNPFFCIPSDAYPIDFKMLRLAETIMDVGFDFPQTTFQELVEDGYNCAGIVEQVNEGGDGNGIFEEMTLDTLSEFNRAIFLKELARVSDSQVVLVDGKQTVEDFDCSWNAFMGRSDGSDCDSDSDGSDSDGSDSDCDYWSK